MYEFSVRYLNKYYTKPDFKKKVKLCKIQIFNGMRSGGLKRYSCLRRTVKE